MKIWVDDIRPAPEGYVHLRTVSEVKTMIRMTENWNEEHKIELLDLDHDAGDYAVFGGDYIEILNWLERTGRSYPIRIHTMNPVGASNMRRIIQKNGWEERK